jgi:hypothetical protein
MLPRNVIACVILALVLGAAVAEPVEDVVTVAAQGAWVQCLDGGFTDWAQRLTRAISAEVRRMQP